MRRVATRRGRTTPWALSALLLAGGGGAALYFYVLPERTARVAQLLPADTLLYVRVSGLDRLEAALGDARLVADRARAARSLRRLAAEVLPARLEERFKVTRAVAQRLVGSLEEVHVAVLRLRLAAATPRPEGVVALVRLDPRAFAAFTETARMTQFSSRQGEPPVVEAPLFEKDAEHKGVAVHRAGPFGYSAALGDLVVFSPERRAVLRVIDASVDGLAASLSTRPGFAGALRRAPSPGVWVHVGGPRLGNLGEKEGLLGAVESMTLALGPRLAGEVRFAGGGHERYRMNPAVSTLPRMVPAHAMALLSLRMNAHLAASAGKWFDEATGGGTRRTRFDALVRSAVDALRAELVFFVGEGSSGYGWIATVNRKDPRLRHAYARLGAGGSAFRKVTAAGESYLTRRGGPAIGFVEDDHLAGASSEALFRQILAATAQGRGISKRPGYPGRAEKASAQLVVRCDALAGTKGLVRPGAWVHLKLVHGRDFARITGDLSAGDVLAWLAHDTRP